MRRRAVSCSVMTPRSILPTLLALALSACGFANHKASAASPDPQPLAIGAPAPDFDLPGVDGKNHTLGEFKDAKILVVIFTCNHCPTAQAYEERIKQMYADYK